MMDFSANACKAPVEDFITNSGLQNHGRQGGEEKGMWTIT